MTLSQSGFRPAYYHFCAFPLNAERRQALAGWPGAADADCMLTRGYIDPEAGLTLEVLALGARKEGQCVFFGTNPSNRVMFRAESLQEEEFLFFADTDGRIAADFAEKLLPLQTYAAPEALERTREIPVLDPCRHPLFPDRVKVQLRQEGVEPEEAWALIDHAEEHRVVARLLHTPERMRGFTEGNSIGFFLEKNAEGRTIAVAELEPDKWLTRAELQDGSLLRAAIRAFTEKRTEENFTEIILLLRDSTVYVPCHTLLSDEDRKAVEKMVKEANGDPERLKGKTFSNTASVTLVPDILENGERLYFPVFSSREEMGEYGKHISPVPRTFLDAITLAKNNEQKPVAIVVDAFTHPYALPADLYKVVEGCRSRIRETEDR